MTFPQIILSTQNNLIVLGTAAGDINADEGFWNTVGSFLQRVINKADFPTGIIFGMVLHFAGQWLFTRANRHSGKPEEGRSEINEGGEV